ncbi:MAG: 3alpha(or 20beta)-hydroxysteroid dehydrogenase [Verrucomicrobiales bacterium]|jgi:3alpha(or 20beta)-hydroxysteroid dehydrogenase
MSRFQGKIVIITGAAGDIGRAAAVRFASEGAAIVAVDLADEDLAETVAAVEAIGGKAIPVSADVTKSADVAAYVRRAIDTFGGVDVLFNNAGIEGDISPLEDYPEAMFDRVLDVNVKGVWLGMRHVAAAMRARGGGAIINSSSRAGLHGTPNLIAYGAAKHAVIGMTKTAAIELAPAGIRVNAVCPGPIDTRMMDAIAAGKDPENPRRLLNLSAKGNPMGRIGTPEEVVALVSFLASDDASYINGSSHSVDGGLAAT